MNPWSEIFPALTHFSAVLCEKVLTEMDQVTSAIRIVDVFNVTPPKDGSRAVIEMRVLVLGRFSDQATETKYALRLGLLGPSGKSAMGEPVELSTEQRYPDVPGGFATEAVINVAVAKAGAYHVVVSINNKDLAHVPFTVRIDAEAAEE